MLVIRLDFAHEAQVIRLAVNNQDALSKMSDQDDDILIGWYVGVQVPLLLSLGEVEGALSKAIDSGDTDLVYLAIFRSAKSLRQSLPCASHNEALHDDYWHKGGQHSLKPISPG